MRRSIRSYRITKLPNGFGDIKKLLYLCAHKAQKHNKPNRSNMVKPYRMSQKELAYTYERAKSLMAAHPEYAEECKKVVDSVPYFKSEKEALQAAIEIEKKTIVGCQIWAKIEKTNGLYRIVNYWIVTDDNNVKIAAEYIGMALMYDDTRILNIIDDHVNIDDVVAYW